MKIFKVVETDHYGYETEPKYFLDKSKAFEMYRTLIEAARNHPELASREDLDGERPIRPREHLGQSPEKDVLAEVTVSIWDEHNTQEGHWSDIISYGIEIREIEVVA